MGHERGERSEGVMRLLKISPAEVEAYLRRNARQILGLALLALLVHDIFGAHGFIAMRRTQKEIEEIRKQIGKIDTENKSLTDQVNSLKTDPKSIERIAREEMGLARPGELIYKLPDSAKPGDSQQPVPQK
jgi:cell division protein FtsB